VFNTHSFETRYTSSWVDDTLQFIGPGYFSKNSSSTQLFSLHYSFISDHRDVRAYPLKGHLAGLELSQFGLGLLPDESSGFLRADAEWSSYNKIDDNWFTGFLVITRLSITHLQPYYLQRGLGFGNDYVRGFEYYVIDGQQTLLSKVFLKYQLISPQVLDLGMGSDKFSKIPYAFYLNFFVDGAFVSDKLYAGVNPLSNKPLGGIGIGLDYVTYYDKVFRVEFAYNSKSEPGIFFHYGVPF
jgi:outer membrane protein assembly factor BamA